MAARDRLIQSAIELMRCDGIAGTGLARLLEHSGISRRTVYLNFPGGKSELMAEATRVAGDGIAAFLSDAVASPDPLAAFVAWWRQLLLSSDYAAGCPIVAAALARSESSAAADTAGKSFTEWQQIIADRLSADGVAPASAVSLASTTIAAVEGAVVMSMATRSTKPLEHAADNLRRLYDVSVG